jgi:hypothetical protein
MMFLAFPANLPTLSVEIIYYQLRFLNPYLSGCPGASSWCSAAASRRASSDWLVKAACLPLLLLMKCRMHLVDQIIAISH